jgi:hypothetical protein
MTDMNICYASDLHADHNQLPIEWPDADVLVIGGDTANSIGNVLKVARKAAKKFAHVVLVDGNHEHYSNAPQGRTVEATIASLATQLPENVHMLGHHRPRVTIDGVHFIGCNGWYSFDAMGDPIENRTIWRETMNDNRWIGFDAIEQTPPWDRAVNDAALMERTLREIADEEDGQVASPIVAVTHTAPHREMVAWRTSPVWNRSNSFYVNLHMEKVLVSPLGQRVTHWYNGHTHHRKDHMVGSVYCICNPRGYPGENPGWEPVVIPIIR